MIEIDSNFFQAVWWRKMLRAERRWSTRLEREGQIYACDRPYVRAQRFRSLFISSLLTSFVLCPKWNFSGKCFFVSFGIDELCHSSIRERPEQFCTLNIGWGALFKGSKLGFVMNSLYLLVNNCVDLPRWFRKYLLVKHIKFLGKLIPQLDQSIFIVKQDYFGPSSILVTLSCFLPLSVVGVQHGLMNPKAILRRKIYPGVRTRIEYVYNDFYQTVLSRVKARSSVVKVLGPPCDCSIRSGQMSVDRKVIFISSGQMQSSDGRNIVWRIKSLSESDGFVFELRPHPSEKLEKSLGDYLLDETTVSTLLKCDPDSILLVGTFSSLLYQAAYKGFRTLWVLNEHGLNLSSLPFLTDVPNAFVSVADEMVPGKLASIFCSDRERISLDTAEARLTKLLRDSILQRTE